MKIKREGKAASKDDHRGHGRPGDDQGEHQEECQNARQKIDAVFPSAVMEFAGKLKDLFAVFIIQLVVDPLPGPFFGVGLHISLVPQPNTAHIEVIVAACSGQAECK